MAQLRRAVQRRAAGRRAFPQGLKPTFSCAFMSELMLRPLNAIYEIAYSFSFSE